MEEAHMLLPLFTTVGYRNCSFPPFPPAGSGHIQSTLLFRDVK